MQGRRAEVEGQTTSLCKQTLSVFEAFSFLLDDGSGFVVSQKTMKPSTPKRTCEDEDDEQRQPITAGNLRRIRKIRKDNGGTAPSEERC
jgi:hypothetical protein